MTTEEYKKSIRENANSSMFARDSFSSRMVPLKQGEEQYRGFNDSQAFNPDLDTPQGLMKLANEYGLGREAERMVKKSGGEQKEFFSGGFVMDVMDVLNIGSYGVVGMVKGVGFKEGVKNRESMSDEDSLGQYGWQGKVAGFALDIILDPFTYLSPLKLVTKVPGVVGGLKRAKDALLGEVEFIKIEGQQVMRREGGWSPLKALSERLVYGFGVDRKYLDSQMKIKAKAENKGAEMSDLISMISKSDTPGFQETIDFAEDGAVITKSLAQLRRGPMSKQITELYTAKDNLMKELLDVGYLSKETFDKHFDSYLTQTYDELLKERNKVPGFGGGGAGLDKKRRLEGLTPERRKELGQNTDAASVWSTTMLKMVSQLEKAKLQKNAAEHFSISADGIKAYEKAGGKAEELHTVRNDTTFKLGGKEAGLTKTLLAVNKTLAKVTKERGAALADDAELTTTLKNINDEMARLKTLSGEQLGEGISSLNRMLREGGLRDGATKKKPTSVGQVAIAESFSKFLNRGRKSDRLARSTIPTRKLLGEYLETTDSIAMEKAFMNPQMMYQWNSMEEFADAVRYPDKAKVFEEPADRLNKLSDAASDAKIKQAEKNTRKMGKLEQEKLVLEEGNRKVIDDVMTKLEDEYSDSLFAKTSILDRLEQAKMGQLAGRVIPKEMWKMLKQSFEPTVEIGENLILPFKNVKVVWNPGSYARNAVGAMIANWWVLGIGPWRVDRYLDATKELSQKGPAYREMTELGFTERDGQIGELTQSLLDNKGIRDSFGKQFGSKNIGTAKLKAANQKLVQAYGYTDNVAKVAAYKYGRKQGLSPEDAMRKAYVATFNYSEVTPFVHSMRRAIWGVPFITFSLKAVPLVATTLKNSPGKISVFGKARNSLFEAAGIEGEQEAEALPDWMAQDAFVMRLPWKDGQGRSMYFDMSYIIPFGAIMDGTAIKNPISQNPALQTLQQLARNQTFTGRRIFNETDDIDTVLTDIFLHTGKLWLPPLAAGQLADGYNSDGKRNFSRYSALENEENGDFGAAEKNYYQKAASIFGGSVQPFSLESRESQLAFKQKENLTKLMVENGIMKEFRSPYIPEDSAAKPVGNLYDSRSEDVSR